MSPRRVSAVVGRARRRLAQTLSTLPDTTRLCWRGLALASAASPRTVIIYLALVFCTNALPVLQVWLGKVIVDRLAMHGSLAASGLTLVGPALLYVLSLALHAAVQPIAGALAAQLEDTAVGEIDRQLIRAGGRLVDLHRIERPAFGDEVRLVQESGWRLPRLFWFIEHIAGTLVTLIGLLFLLGRLQPLLPIVLVSTTVPYLVAALRLNHLKYQAMVRRSRAAREMDYCLHVTTEPAAAKEVRAFGLGTFFLHRFHDRSHAALREVEQLRLHELRHSAAFGALQALALGSGFWYVATEAGGHRLTLGDVALYLGAVVQAESRLSLMAAACASLNETLIHLRGLLGFLDSAGPSIVLSPEGASHPLPEATRVDVAMHELSFRYPESSETVLADITTFLPAGKVTALVGANGAGKSTFVKLLTRMYDPDGGSITIDGRPLAAYDLDALRGCIAVTYQDFARLSLSMRDNIAVGAPVNGDLGRSVDTAAQWAGADEVATRLPRGYDTDLTRRFAGGVDLSGGEWQKVALARSCMRDPALLILDEPTAALDADAEEQLWRRFRELMAGKTVLLISHRLSTVRMADHIIVLEDGHIVETGSHSHLLTLGGRYATLFAMQAGRYQ